MRMSETQAPADFFDTGVAADHLRQMTYGERFAIEGLLCSLRPRLALETGTAQGGTLRRIAAWSEEVHSFDIDPSVAELQHTIPNATFHIGDSAIELPKALAELHAAGRHVDFAMVDGDHTAAGVQRDTRALLASGACQRTVIVFHDTANDDVRSGLDELSLNEHPKVALVMLDFVPGYLCVPDHEHYPLAAWNGLGLAVLGERGDQGAVIDRDHLPVPDAYKALRQNLTEAGLNRE